MSTQYSGAASNVSIPAKLTVSAASNASPIVITTSGAHGLSPNDTVIVSSVLGNTAANGRWAIVVLTSTTFQLVGSTGNGAYTSGGFVYPRTSGSTYAIPSDADDLTAASVNVAFEALGDRTAFNTSRAPAYYLAGMWPLLGGVGTYPPSSTNITLPANLTWTATAMTLADAAGYPDFQVVPGDLVVTEWSLSVQVSNEVFIEVWSSYTGSGGTYNRINGATCYAGVLANVGGSAATQVQVGIKSFEKIAANVSGAYAARLYAATTNIGSSQTLKIFNGYTAVAKLWRPI